MTVRSVQLGALPAPPGNPAIVYAVPEGGHFGLFLWNGAEFIRRANVDVGDTTVTLVRREAWVPPLAALLELGEWRIVGADAGFIYLAIEVDLT